MTIDHQGIQSLVATLRHLDKLSSFFMSAGYPLSYSDHASTMSSFEWGLVFLKWSRGPPKPELDESIFNFLLEKRVEMIVDFRPLK